MFVTSGTFRPNNNETNLFAEGVFMEGFQVSWLSVNLWVEAIRKHLSCSEAAGCVSKSVGVGKQRPKISSMENMNPFGSLLLGQHR